MESIDNQVEYDDHEEEKLSAKATQKKTQNRKIWTQREDKMLDRAIQEFGTNWKEVAKHLYNRNPSQCAQRWKRIKPVSQRCRHSWTTAEDKQLLDLVKIHKRNWGMIASVMHWRTGKQIRERFINKLNPDIRPDPWTKEEDLIVMEAYQKFGSRWTEISKLLQGRPENMIKNRFYSYIRKEYMNIQNPYYIIPNLEQKQDEQQQLSQNHDHNDIPEIDQEAEQENSYSPKPEDNQKVKPNKPKQVQKKRISKKQFKNQVQNEQQNCIKELNAEEEVLNGIAATYSSNELQVKEEEEIEVQPNLKNWPLVYSQNSYNNPNQFPNNQLNSSQLFEPIKSLYNSQLQNQQIQTSSTSQQQQQQQYYAAVYYSYCEGIAKIMRSQSLSQSIRPSENQPILTNSSSQDTQQSGLSQSQLLQLSIPNMAFLQFPYIVRQESFPQSMNNSQF